MSLKTKQKIVLSVLLVAGIQTFMIAQDNGIVLTQDSKFEQLLQEKRKINSSITLNNRYKIQVFSGNAAETKLSLADFKQNFAGIDATVVFNTPIYKIWVGSYKSRIEAEQALEGLEKKYPNAFLIKPNR